MGLIPVYVWVRLGPQKKSELKQENKEKWKENVSHAEECSRLQEVTLIGVLAARAREESTSFSWAGLRKRSHSCGRCQEWLR